MVEKLFAEIIIRRAFQRFRLTYDLSDNLSFDDFDFSLQSVTAKNVQEVGMKYIYDHCPVIAAVGQIENLTDYNRVRAGMYWIRV